MSLISESIKVCDIVWMMMFVSVFVNRRVWTSQALDFYPARVFALCLCSYYVIVCVVNLHVLIKGLAQMKALLC